MNLLFFKADSCKVCGPVLNRVMKVVEGSEHEIEVLNVAEEKGRRAATRYHVTLLPTMIIANGRVPIMAMVGESIPELLVDFLDGKLSI
jgi:hypothetical protein